MIVRVALFELANAVLSEVVPETPTRYAVGVETLIDAGVKKVTRRVLPTTVVTADGFVVTAAPPAAG